MKHMKFNLYSVALAAAMLSFTACSDDNTDDTGKLDIEHDGKYVGQAVGNFTADEWYPGGKLGTTNSTVAGSYQDETPAVDENEDLVHAFNEGEMLFEHAFNYATTGAYKGLGPASVRKACIDCHPSYGHGKRQEGYSSDRSIGNGYLLVVYHPVDGANSNDGGYIAEVTGMPQTQAASPFKAPIDESKITINWKTVDKMESGLAMQFPDNGEKFSLIYPEVNIPQDAFHTDPKPTNLAFRLESTIGIGGTGLIDAIPEEDIIQQYKDEAAYFKKAGLDVKEYLNPSFYDADKGDMADGAFYTKWTSAGKHMDGTAVAQRGMLKRYTYALTRASLQDGPGANAIWNITNVSRPDRPYLYTTNAWAKAMAEDEEVIAAIMADPTSPYYASTKEETAKKVEALLSPGTNQFKNDYHNFSPEMTNDQFYALMVWHRGLAIPRARNLNDPEVQQGKKLFMEMGCAGCHRPSWKTGNDNYYLPDCIEGKKLPQYKNQTIYPYSDLLQHKLYMKNDIHGSWCRTTPLWGRGLSMINTGAEDRLHDCRARNEVEAIMWHAYSKNSHAYNAALKFYNLKKADRDAVVKFLRSI